ncbi:MAG: glutamate racemase, partial [Abditibacteriota bacterium]|nr:glutamate racemase [Abditibacteriota bacterium]
AQLLYFADTAHVPYGDRTSEEVRFFALSISEFLIGHGAQMVVFACNTSSAYALDEARTRFDRPLFGMIEPGARAALKATRHNRIGVLATQATVESGVYSHTLGRLRAQTLCIEEACPEFVPLVESEQTASPAAHTAARKYLAPLLQSEVDTIIMGCTHYPLLLPVLRQAAPHCCFIDPAEAVAIEVAQKAAQVAEQESHNGRDAHMTAPKYFERDHFFVSGESSGVRRWIKLLLPQSHPTISAGPVFEIALNENSQAEKALGKKVPAERLHSVANLSL